MVADEKDFKMDDESVFDELDELSGELESAPDEFAADMEDDDEPLEGVIVEEGIIIAQPAPAASASAKPAIAKSRTSAPRKKAASTWP